MNKNTLLKTAVFLCKLAKLFLGLLLIGFTVFFIHFQIDRSAYENWSIKNPGDSSKIEFVRTNSTTSINDLDKVYPIEDWSTVSLYSVYLKFGGIVVLIFLSIHQFQKVMQSVKNLHTFQGRNVRSFRKIGLYCILIFCFQSFGFLKLGTYTAAKVSFETTPLLIALFAFILAEIFKEGNLLMEENQLTV